MPLRSVSGANGTAMRRSNTASAGACQRASRSRANSHSPSSECQDARRSCGRGYACEEPAPACSTGKDESKRIICVQGAQRPLGPQPWTMDELQRKLAAVRGAMERHGLAAVRLRGTDWFAWATCGGSNTVLLTTDTGIAEVLILRDAALVLTDEIEAGRLRDEELPRGFDVAACRWIDRPGAWDRLARERASGGAIASDRPAAGEVALPADFHHARSSLSPEELARYELLGR